MNKILALSIFVTLFFTIQSCSSTTDSSNKYLKEVILQCNSCHTTENIPSLNGMDAQYLIGQLENFRFDKRGMNSLSPQIQEMSKQAKKLKSNELQAIANYYEALPIIHSTETVPGDIDNGKLLYETNCQGCHSSIIGRFFTNSPQISHLNGPYILEQLSMFSRDERGFYVENKHKIKMREVSKKFSVEELSAITAYLKSNKP